MTDRKRVGRPYGSKIAGAFRVILEGRCPVSTTMLIERFNLSEHECIALRRALRTAESRDQLQSLGIGPDGSNIWMPKSVPLVQCAAHVANTYLQSHEAGISVDPVEFEEWLAATGCA